MLALGQAERRVGALAEVVGQRVRIAGFERLGGDGVRLPPGDVALAERPGAGEDLVERAVGGGEGVLVDWAGRTP